MVNMNRFVLLMVAAAALGCATKPSEDECRKAISNMQVLMGTENLGDSEMIESQVRRCKGGSSKKSVQCAIKAQTLDDLRKCEFFKLPPNTQIPGATGSAGAAGSAGSAAAPPAGTGSAAGSAVPAEGSAGSAATGSAATGSAAGTGSASGSPATGSAATPSGAAGSAATAPGGVGSAK
jgi:hypothetical protein